MYKYISWFQNNYTELHQEMLGCNHNIDNKNLNPYHLESDCWSHTMMVCKIAEMQGYSKEVQIAALLHDIGKPKSRTINPKNNHVRFFGHETISSYLAIDILNKMLEENMISSKEMVDIHILIAYHGELYRNTDAKSIYYKFKFDKRLYLLLTQLSYCDNMGRFSADIRTTKTDESRIVEEYFSNALQKNNEIDKPYIKLLCGISQSKKLSYLDHRYTETDTVIIDNKLQKDKYLKALSEYNNIVICLPNLTIKSRNMWLEDLPGNYYRKAEIFLENKNKNMKIDSIQKFSYPLYDEVDQFKYHIA